MANWTPTGFIGQMFKIVASYVPPPPNMPAPLLWGVEDTVRERLGQDVQTNQQMIRFIYPFGPDQTVDYFRLYYGPAQKAFDALDEAGRNGLRRDMEQHWTKYDEATDGTTNVPAEYLKVIAVRA